jgi:hypothetical protein
VTEAPRTPEEIDAVLSRVAVREYRPGDEAAILAVFHKVFPWATRSIAEWNWEFRDNPAGLHCFLAALPEGRVLAQFTGLPRRVKVGAETRIFAEIVDSLTDPDFRQGLKKPGLFGQCVYAYVDHFGRPDRETVMYGLPNPPAFRIGARLFGYSFLHDVGALYRDVRPAAGELPPVAALGEGRIEEVAAVPADLDPLWERTAPEYDVTVVRDRRYLAWRYDEKPGGKYRRYALRDAAGRLLAFWVTVDRWIEGELKKNVTAVVEWVVDRRHPFTKAIPEYVPHAARAAGADEAWFVFRPQSDEWNHCSEVGYLPTAAPFRFVARTYDPAVSPLDRLRDRWFYCLGDFDVA